MKVLNVASEFSPVPMGRFRKDGDKSGEAFRDDLLYPQISEAINKKEILAVDFEGMKGLSGSFLDEAFGGLVRLKEGPSAEDVLKTLKFLPEHSHFDSYIDLTKYYIRKAGEETSAEPPVNYEEYPAFEEILSKESASLLEEEQTSGAWTLKGLRRKLSLSNPSDS